MISKRLTFAWKFHIMHRRHILFIVLCLLLSGCSGDPQKFYAIDGFFVDQPLWLIYAYTLILILGSISVGYRYARYRKRKSQGKEEASLGPVVSGLMGLLAFILAFTFGLANNRYNERKDLMLNEVTTIETSYYRTYLLPEQNGQRIRNLLKSYTTLRLKAYNPKQPIKDIINESEVLKRKIWMEIMDLSDEKLQNPVVYSLILGSINDMFNIHTKRVTIGTIYHLPAVLWIALYLLVIFTMLGIGYSIGQSIAANRLMVAFFALGFTCIILLIADLDHGGTKYSGFIRVNPKPMIDLEQRIYANP